MSFQFATCERGSALGFLKKIYPDREVLDTPECAGPLLDEVAKDFIRITDPDFHIGEVIPGKKYVETPENRERLTKVASEFHEALTSERIER